MLSEMKALAREKTFCVLATAADDQPYCSLMAYAADKDCRHIYMATGRSSQKFRNLRANPKVSLLIDSRDALPPSQARALTVTGRCEAVVDAVEKQGLCDRLIAVHPHLRDFFLDPQNEILSVRIESFLLLKGLTESFFELAD